MHRNALILRALKATGIVAAIGAVGETAAAAAVGFGFGLFNHWMYSELFLPVLFSFAAAVRLHVELRWRARRRLIRGERLSRRRGYRVTAEPERLPSSRPAC